MKPCEFYKLINLNDDAVKQLNEYEKSRNFILPEDLRKKMFIRETWDEAVKDLQKLLGEDPYGMKVLWEQINLVLNYSYPEYQKNGISDDVFVQTFGFISRFVNANRTSDGKYKYIHAWWLPRQITLQEFRIGSLEYEFVNLNGHMEVEVHIPSDADMKIEALCQSVKDFFAFRKQYFKDWTEAPLTTETWMIMPELEDFLPPESKILAFKHLFDIDKVDYEQTWYMDWIFPGYTEINESLPEKTTLHKKLKNHLLSGRKFGIAKGHLVTERVFT